MMARKVATGITSEILLNDGVSMPLYGLGCGPGANQPCDGTLENPYQEKAVKFAIQNGHRMVDASQYHR